MAGLDERRERFCQEFVIDLNATQAATRAGYSAKTAKQQGSRLLSDADVLARIQELKAAVAEKLNMGAEDVLREWITIATADPDELISHLVYACRHCHGDDHLFQWRSRREYEEVLAMAAASKQAQDRMKEDPDYDPDFDTHIGGAMPSDDGGYGYHGNLVPHPDCPKCDGHGLTRVVVADTRRARGAARKLYAGVKQTRNGIEVLMRDQDKALDSIARYLGLFTEKVDVTINGGLADRLARAKAKMKEGLKD